MKRASFVRLATDRPSMPRFNDHVYRLIGTPLRITLLFAAFSAVWIIGSDLVLREGLLAEWGIPYLDTLKGFLYVATCSLFLFLLLRTWKQAFHGVLEHFRSSQQCLERVLEGVDEGWWEWDVARDDMFFSERWWEMFGIPAGERQASRALWRELTHPEDVTNLENALHDAIERGMTAVRIEQRMRHHAGHYLPVLVRYTIQRDGRNKPVFVSGSCMDLTELRNSELRLRQAAAVFETAREGILISDTDNRIVMVNNAFQHITGYSEQDAIGKTPAILHSGRHDSTFYQDLWSSLKQAGYWQGEIWNRRKNGEIYPQLLSISTVTTPDGTLTHYVAVYTDISRLKDSELQLEYLAHHDALTGLPNRLLFSSRLEHCIASARREHSQLAILMLDTDRFKDVNDSFGHNAGDELLQMLAHRLQSLVRGSDTVARLGGDEFIVILENISHLEDAAHVASDLIQKLAGPWRLSNGVELHVGFSVGISIFPQHAASSKELLQQADAALYQAKREGRGCFRYYSEDLTQAARERLDLETRLHRALDNDELVPFFQPQIDIANGKIIGAEALVRWLDPEEGLISPARFIPVAEMSNLIADIGERMLRETCRLGRQWRDQGLPAIRLAVNLSMRQFLHADITQLVQSVLMETGFPASGLELELTESILMEREQDVINTMLQLRRMGVKLALDDFGTGYSSLSYLKQLPLDVLKIDKRFIDSVPQDQGDVGIVSTTISMGHFMGFNVLAEGVENPAQLQFLRERGCDLYQGFLFSKPLPADEFAALLAGQSQN